ncbi:MAG: diaminopimelate decarboxylase [Planctomycetota bacterium]
MADPAPDRTVCPQSGAPEFHYRRAADGVPELWCEDQPLDALAARFGTPLYVYSAGSIRQRWQALRAAFGDGAAICYAVKANPNLALLRLLAGLGAGFDLVSGGELRRLGAAGIDPRRAVFAGAAKQRWEIEAGVAAGVKAFSVESPHELPLLSAAGAACGRVVPVSLRLNPAIAVDTHAYIATARHDSKFGIDLDQAGELVTRIAADRNLDLCGYHVHLGSQLRAVEPYVEALRRVLEFVAGDPVRRRGVRHYDLGGGFGIGYGQGAALDPNELAAAVLPILRQHALEPMLEPGRYLVGDAGVLLTEVLGHKRSGRTEFVLVDAAMTELVRPALYAAEHPIAPLRRAEGPTRTVDVVGPVCESGDFLARGRDLPVVAQGQRLAVFGAGAYGAAMASTYNSRPRPAEVLVDGDVVRLIRRRETLAQLWADDEPVADDPSQSR